MRAKKGEKWKRIIGILSAGMLCLAVVLCLLVTVQVSTKGYVSLFGSSLFRVATGSMEPTLSVGSVLICRTEPIGDISRGDIVCFRSRQSGQLGRVVTHRVVAVLEDAEGNVLLETKGDANLSADGNPVSQDNLIGRVVWYSGKDGGFQKTLSFVTGKVGFLACVVFPILLIAGMLLRENVLSIQRQLRQTVDALAREEALREKEKAYKDLFTPQEYQQMYDRIRAELMEELKQNEANQKPCPEEDRTEE